MSYPLKSALLSENIDAADLTSAAIVDESLSRKDHLMERLSKRNKDRQSNLDVKLEQRHAEQLQLEGVDFFAQTFTERVRDIETRIAAATDQKPSDLVCHFAALTLEIQELQRYLTASTMFLTDFKIKNCQAIINELTASSEEAQMRLLPKKKFGFRGKKVAPKVTINPKVSSAAADKLDAIEKSAAVASSAAAAFEWTLCGRKDAHIVLCGAEVDNKDITIKQLDNCLVELQGHAGSVQISNATNCTFLCGPIARSLFAEHVHSSTLAVACQQLRLHSSTQCRIYLHVTCRAIIEDCKAIEVANYCYDYPTIQSDFQLAGLDQNQNNYTDVADFNWLSPDVPSPNWHLQAQDCTAPDWDALRREFGEKTKEIAKQLDGS